jgi:translation initiation factor IF-3
MSNVGDMQRTANSGIWEELHIAAHKDTRRNEDINAPQVRVIKDDGEQAGVMRVEQALELAEEEGLDLVEIVPNADPPVCRIMDYGKFKFEATSRRTCAPCP